MTHWPEDPVFSISFSQKAEMMPSALAEATAAIGALQGSLRAVHLAAHLETRALLTPQQIVRYQHLRG